MQLLRRTSLRHVYEALCLVALLICGQQGAVVHELGHLAAAQGVVLRVDSSATAEGNCTLCPVFAQVATAAFSHSFQFPVLAQAGIELLVEPPVAALARAVPTPRSRGPPSLS